MTEAEASEFCGLRGARHFRDLFRGQLVPTISLEKETAWAKLLTDEEAAHVFITEMKRILDRRYELKEWKEKLCADKDPAQLFESIYESIYENIYEYYVNDLLMKNLDKELEKVEKGLDNPSTQEFLARYVVLKDEVECYGRLYAMHEFASVVCGPEGGIAVLTGYAAARISLVHRLSKQLGREYRGDKQEGLLSELAASVCLRVGPIHDDPVRQLAILHTEAAKEVGAILSRDGDNRTIGPHVELLDIHQCPNPIAEWEARQDYYTILATLPQQQRICLNLVGLGYTYKEIADELQRSPETVKYNIAEGRKKLPQKN